MTQEVNVNTEKTILNTQNGLSDGQNKCPKCGATDVDFNIATGKLRCNYCRFEFTSELVNHIDDLNDLTGTIVGSGAQDIIANEKDILTFKCESCAAEVVIDTNESLNARCHWCRNTLTVNQQIPNGAVPDMILPFSVKKEDAQVCIEKFVKKRNFFAHPKFKQEFQSNNVMGVYLPYMVVDINGKASFSGEGEILVRRYTVGSGDHKDTKYDADAYSVTRNFDITIDDLTIEANSDKLNLKDESKTTNIINAILPFDTENCVTWNANFLKGFSSEKRDTNVEQLGGILEAQSIDVAKHKANASLTQYNRGVCWKSSDIQIVGQKWKATYLPVWLYSYQQIKGDKKVLHYVAVNARNKETMGSVPVYVPKLLFFSFLVELLGLFMMLFVDHEIRYLFLALGFVYYFVIYAHYRNNDARHTHESETRSEIKNLVKNDTFIKRKKGLDNSRISGENNTSFGNRSDKLFSLDKISKEFNDNLK